MGSGQNSLFFNHKFMRNKNIGEKKDILCQFIEKIGILFDEGNGVCDKQRHGEKLGGYLLRFWIFGMPRGKKGVAGWRLGVEGEEWKGYGGLSLCHTLLFIFGLCLS